MRETVPAEDDAGEPTPPRTVRVRTHIGRGFGDYDEHADVPADTADHWALEIWRDSP